MSGPPADTACWGRCHAPMKSRRKIPDRRRATQRKVVRPNGRQPERESARRRSRSLHLTSDVADDANRNSKLRGSGRFGAARAAPRAQSSTVARGGLVVVGGLLRCVGCQASFVVCVVAGGIVAGQLPRRGGGACGGGPGSGLDARRCRAGGGGGPGLSEGGGGGATT